MTSSAEEKSELRKAIESPDPYALLSWWKSRPFLEAPSDHILMELRRLDPEIADLASRDLGLDAPK